MYHATIFGQGRVTSQPTAGYCSSLVAYSKYSPTGANAQSASTRHACMEAGPRLRSPMDLPMCPNLLDGNWQSGASAVTLATRMVCGMCVAVDKVTL